MDWVQLAETEMVYPESKFKITQIKGYKECQATRTDWYIVRLRKGAQAAGA